MQFSNVAFKTALPILKQMLISDSVFPYIFCRFSFFYFFYFFVFLVRSVQYYEGTSHAIIRCVWIVGVCWSQMDNCDEQANSHLDSMQQAASTACPACLRWLIIGPFNLAFSAIRLSASATTTPWGYYSPVWLAGKTYCIAPVFFTFPSRSSLSTHFSPTSA